jgi:hypothetical protein
MARPVYSVAVTPAVYAVEPWPAAQPALPVSGSATIALTGSVSVFGRKFASGSTTLGLTGSASAFGRKFAAGGTTLALTGTASAFGRKFASGGTTIALTGTASAAVVGAPSVPGLPGLLDTRFHWDAQTLDADWLGGTVPPVYQLAGIADEDGAPVLGTNPYDGQTWAVINGAWDKWDWWIDTDEPTIWGATTGKQWVRLRYMVETAFTADMLLMQVNAKTRDPGNPLNGNAGIRLDTTTSASNPAIIGSAVTVVIPGGSFAAGDEIEVILKRNVVTSNAGGAITEALYIRRTGYDTVAGYGVATTTAPDQPYYHNIQPGNDRATSGAYYLRGFYFGRDFAHDLPVVLWQNFDIASLSQANLEASDHHNSFAWAGTGTTSRFSLVTDTIPHPAGSTINLYDASVGKILRNDLTATASGAWGYTNTDSASLRAHGMWVRIVSGLASGTSARIAYATNTTNSSTFTVAVEVRNNAGQHELYLNNGSTTSSPVNISPDTWYWVAWTARQSNTCTLWAYNTAGSELTGSGVTVTGANRAVGSGRIGSTAAYTAQSSGVAIDVAHFVYSSTASARLIPWEVSP